MLLALQILEVLLPLFYAVVFVVYLRQFLSPSSDEGAFFRGPTLLYAGLTTHLGYLILHGIEFHHFPVTSRADFLSLVAFCVGLVYAFAERKHKNANTGVFFIALVVATQAWSSILMEHSYTHPILYENPIYAIHVIFTVFGFTALALSALYALMYILLSRQLKSRNLGLIFRRLPPLNVLENMSRLATLCGIAFLGAGLATGHFLAVYVLDDYFNLFDPKIVITYIAWLAYVLGYLIVKLRGLSGLRIGYISLGGYLLLIASMVVVNSFLTTFHSFAF